MKALTFYDLKGKKKFTTTKYVLTKTANGRKMVKTKSPSGSTSTLFVGKDFKA